MLKFIGQILIPTILSTVEVLYDSFWNRGRAKDRATTLSGTVFWEAERAEKALALARSKDVVSLLLFDFNSL